MLPATPSWSGPHAAALVWPVRRESSSPGNAVRAPTPDATVALPDFLRRARPGAVGGGLVRPPALCCAVLAARLLACLLHAEPWLTACLRHTQPMLIPETTSPAIVPADGATPLLCVSGRNAPSFETLAPPRSRPTRRVQRVLL